MRSVTGSVQKAKWHLSFIAFANSFGAVIDWHDFFIFGVV